jgi:hypothetical protein
MELNKTAMTDEQFKQLLNEVRLIRSNSSAIFNAALWILVVLVGFPVITYLIHDPAFLRGWNS